MDYASKCVIEFEEAFWKENIQAMVLMPVILMGNSYFQVRRVVFQRVGIWKGLSMLQKMQHHLCISRDFYFFQKLAGEVKVLRFA